MDDTGDKEDQPPERGDARATPVIMQFLDVKAAHPGCLLFYRMGDFYELFFEDAEIAARDLGITLTKRGRHLGVDIPMCGVPVHSADAYLQRLIRLGHRVAICEQMEDPAEARKRGSKAVVRRDVVRLVTPGTLTEDNLLDARSSNYLATVACRRGTGEVAIAWADISSGELSVMVSGQERLASDLARLAPREIVLADTLLAEPSISTNIARCGAPVTPYPAVRFELGAAERRLKDHFSVLALDGFGSFQRSEIEALGGLLDYVLMTQAGKLPHLREPRRELSSSALLIDAATRANLELTRTLSGDVRGSLLSVIDLTVTAAGSRNMAGRISTPLCEPEDINARLDEVAHLVETPNLRDAVRQALSGMPDIGRALGRLAVGRGGPRDLAALRDGLAVAKALAQLLPEPGGFPGLPLGLEALRHTFGLRGFGIAEDLTAALAEELPLNTRDGGFVRQGYAAELDECRTLRDQTRQVIAGLQLKYVDESGIKSLKIRHNNVLGYFIEVPTQAASALLAPSQSVVFFHRQTVASATRFVTTELAGLDQRIAAAADRAIAIEQDIFHRLVTMVLERRSDLSALADAAAYLDTTAALAALAVQRRYVRPKVDGTSSFVIKGGRHPVVEAALQQSASGTFVANDCDLSGEEKRLWLLTGPNMAGKSTFLRQNALAVILAQAGSYVAADSAHIGTVDRLFSRVGASDDLARGRSTFMVEMVETAAILNQATERSFVILDEIGRGTSTFDGLSIAWAAVEHLHETNRCRALFATHYHELTALAGRLPHVANATVKVKEWNEDIIFLHSVTGGVADRSYGIHVARLAGLPASVVARARKVLERLERGQAKPGTSSPVDDLPLFATKATPAPRQSLIEKKLAGVYPDALSPREALDLIYELKALLSSAP